MSKRNDPPRGTQRGPDGAAQGENWLGGPHSDRLREKAAKQARTVVEDGDKNSDAERSDADAAKDRERQMEEDGTETPG